MGQRKVDFVKNPQEINVMREGGAILGHILGDLKNTIKPGLAVMDLEKRFIELCDKNNVIPTCKGFSPYGAPPFPTGLCVSINSQSVHCYPKPGVKLNEGDLVTIDTVIMHKGLNLDGAFATGVGNISERDRNLLKASERGLYDAINKVSDGTRIGVISNRMQKTIETSGFNVLKEYAGHGIGEDMHEWPEILCYGDKNTGPKILEGMTICIESLTCSGLDKVNNLNFWETYMADGGRFVQFEHTVLVKKEGYEILTLIN